MSQKRLNDMQEWQNKHEDLLIAIDQLEQLTEVMSDALHRVKQQAATLEYAIAETDKENEHNKKLALDIDVLDIDSLNESVH